ncbi:MAG: hypothetical protein GY915_06645, partial [bacterium]|nr:hypothetical protein [bacterium]
MTKTNKATSSLSSLPSFEIALKSFISPETPASKALEKLVGPRLFDLILHKPVGLLNRKFYTSLDQAHSGELVSFILTPTDYTAGRRRGQPSRVHCQDEAGNLCDLVFFKAMGDYLSRILPLGEKRFVSGALKGPTHFVVVDEFSNPHTSDFQRWVFPQFVLNSFDSFEP